MNRDENNKEIEKRMEEAKKVLTLPLNEKIDAVNSYLQINGYGFNVTESKLGNHNGKHAMLNCIYMQIHKPHLSPAG